MFDTKMISAKTLVVVDPTVFDVTVFIGHEDVNNAVTLLQTLC